MNGGGARWHWLALGLAIVAVLAVGVRLAWLGDDAYITLRSVENWVTGRGLCWNAGERVQTYTHPAWMLVLAAGRALTGESYFTTIAVSLAIATAAAALLLRLAATATGIAVVALLLLGTRAFGDYMTSGLETPLTCLLLVLFVRVARAPDPTIPATRRFPRVVLLAALLATNRMDLLLLCAPAVLAALRGVRWPPALRLGAVASLPFTAWLLVAIVWYGDPFPVTAHAKAFGTGIPAADLAVQGLRYVRFALTDDPVLLPAIGLGLTLGLRQAGTRWLAFGALLYVGYVVKVGGDFMAGRFLLPPFVVAVAIVAPWLASRSLRTHGLLAGVAVVLLAARGVPAWLRSPATDQAPSEAEIEAQWGIGDERRVYYPQLGLLAPTRAIPVSGSLASLVRPAGEAGRWIQLNGAVGVAGFLAGDRGHVLDPLLCDPLLARLPARDPSRWRIGHVLRRIPEGWFETLATGSNRLRHPGLRVYHDALRAATQGPLWSGERFAAIFGLLTGAYDAGLRNFVAEDYRNPPRLPVQLADLPPALPPGTWWFDEPRLRVVYDGGLALDLGRVETARGLRLQLAGFCDFRVTFLRAGARRGDAMAQVLPPPADVVGLRAVAGLRDAVVEVPAAVADYDTLWIDAVVNATTHTATGPPVLGAVASRASPR